MTPKKDCHLVSAATAEDYPAALDNVHLHQNPQPQDPMVRDRMEPVALHHKENPPTMLEMANYHHLGKPMKTPGGTVLDNVHLNHHHQHQDPMVKERMEPVALHHEENPWIPAINWMSLWSLSA